jgi:hypothetical protein
MLAISGSGEKSLLFFYVFSVKLACSLSVFGDLNREKNSFAIYMRNKATNMNLSAVRVRIRTSLLSVSS